METARKRLTAAVLVGCGFVLLMVVTSLAIWQASLQQPRPFVSSLRSTTMVNGITFGIRGLSRVQDRVDLSVCFYQPAGYQTGYLPREMTLTADGQRWNTHSAGFDFWIDERGQALSRQEFVRLTQGGDGADLIGQCNWVSFPAPAESAGRKATLTIGAIADDQVEGFTCESMAERLQGYPFDVECLISPGIFRFTVRRWPDNMDMQEAQRIAGEVILDYRRGPWVLDIVLP